MILRAKLYEAHFLKFPSN